MLPRPALIIKIQAGISKLSGVSWFMVHGSLKGKTPGTQGGGQNVYMMGYVERVGSHIRKKIPM
jgi:hypothetical protein